LASQPADSEPQHQEYDPTQKSLVSPEFPSDPPLPTGLRVESITLREPILASSIPPASKASSAPPPSAAARYSSDPAPTIKSETAPPVADSQLAGVATRRRGSGSATMADSPQGFASARARERAVSAASLPEFSALSAAKSGSNTKWWVLGGLAAMAALALALSRGVSKQAPAPISQPTIQAVVPAVSPVVSAARAPSEVAAAPSVMASAVAAITTAEAPPAASVVPNAAAVTAPALPSAAPALPSAASAAPSAASAADVAAVTHGGKISVLINVRPPQARIFYKGKEVGKAPLTVEVEPGKRRVFEVVLPGFETRKLVVDGTKPHLLVGLRPSSESATRVP
jgi:hypothetical protein